MSGFGIYLIVLIFGYIIYYGIVIAQDIIKIKKSGQSTAVEEINVSDMESDAPRRVVQGSDGRISIETTQNRPQEFQQTAATGSTARTATNTSIQSTPTPQQRPGTTPAPSTSQRQESKSQTSHEASSAPIPAAGPTQAPSPAPVPGLTATPPDTTGGGGSNRAQQKTAAPASTAQGSTAQGTDGNSAIPTEEDETDRKYREAMEEMEEIHRMMNKPAPVQYFALGINEYISVVNDDAQSETPMLERG